MKPISTVSDNVVLENTYIYNTKIGNDRKKRPELLTNKYTNIIFELDINQMPPSKVKDMRDPNLCQYGRSPLVDLATIEDILLSLDDRASLPVDEGNDPYLLQDNKTQDVFFTNQYDAIAPMRKAISDHLHENNELFLDVEKSLLLEGPIKKLLTLLCVKGITEIDTGRNIYTNQIEHFDVKKAIFSGLTTEECPLILPMSRCFQPKRISHWHHFTKIYLVIAPHNESIIPSTICQTSTNPSDILKYVGISTLGTENSSCKFIQYPSSVISFMIVPGEYTAKAVAKEVIDRCKYYTQASNISMRSCREIATICLGKMWQSFNAVNIPVKTIENVKYYFFEEFCFCPEEPHYEIFTYERNVPSYTRTVLSDDFINDKANEKIISKLSLSGHLLLGQYDEAKSISTQSYNFLQRIMEKDPKNIHYENKIFFFLEELKKRLLCGDNDKIKSMAENKSEQSDQISSITDKQVQLKNKLEIKVKELRNVVSNDYNSYLTVFKTYLSKQKNIQIQKDVINDLEQNILDLENKDSKTNKIQIKQKKEEKKTLEDKIQQEIIQNKNSFNNVIQQFQKFLSALIEYKEKLLAEAIYLSVELGQNELEGVNEMIFLDYIYTFFVDSINLEKAQINCSEKLSEYKNQCRNIVCDIFPAYKKLEKNIMDLKQKRTDSKDQKTKLEKKKQQQPNDAEELQLDINTIKNEITDFNQSINSSATELQKLENELNTKHLHNLLELYQSIQEDTSFDDASQRISRGHHKFFKST